MSEQSGTLLHERYRLDAEIGRGAMGVVYRAHDTLLQRDVAVKVLSAATLDDDSRARLLREAQAAAQLNHPNIASVHDAGETDGVPFIVIELVAGSSLHGQPPDSIDEAIDVASQICAALDHAHDQGIIHRDLKPENVLLTASGTAKLVDFGLARTVSSRLTTEGAILGTIRYISPEQAQGQEVDARSDLYALGVMLYEWTARRPPFTEGPPAVILSQHLHTPVVPPREHDAEIPHALDALIVQLMAKRPQDRPTSAAEVRLALEALVQGAVPAGPVEKRVILPGFLLDQGEEDSCPAFVARERELARLDSFLDAALVGKGTVAFVTGGPGRGKTALLDAFSRQAMDEHPKLLVASGSCNAYSGIGDPYLPFREALAALTGDVEARWALGAISRDHARRLWQALPAAVGALLDSGPHVIPALVPGEPLLDRATAACPGAPWLEKLADRVARAAKGSAAAQLEQSHLFQQVTNVLHALAAQHPLLLILDDLQWVDRSSGGLLFHLGRRLEGARILLLGAYRPEEVAIGVEEQRHPLEKLLAEFKRLYGDVWLALVDGDEGEGRRFVDALLETESNALGDAFRQALAEQAQGHPLFTVELLRAVQERGDLVRDEAGRWVEGPALDWEKMPARVEGVIAERIDRLGKEQREILTVASVEGEDFTAEVVGQVRSVGTRELVQRLSGELQKEHQLVRARGLRRLETRRLSLYRFQHHLFQKYLYSRLDTVERACLHEDVGNALEALYGEQTSEVAVQLGMHYAEARVNDRAVHYFGRAGVLAAKRYANEEAMAHLSRALEIVPEADSEGRFHLLVSRVKVYDLLGLREEQRKDLVALDALSAGLDNAEQQATVANLRAIYANHTADYPAQMASAQRTIEYARLAGSLELQAEGHMRLKQAYYNREDYVAVLKHSEAALALARASDLRHLEAQALDGIASYWHTESNYRKATKCEEQALDLFRQVGDRPREGSTIYSIGLFALSEGKYGQARTCYEESLRLARELGNRLVEAFSISGLGSLYYRLGCLSRARSCLEQGTAIANEVEEPSLEASIASELGEVLLSQGEPVAARACLNRVLGLAGENYPTEAGMALAALGRFHTEQQDPCAAREHFVQALQTFRQIDEEPMEMRSLAGQATAALSLGNLEEACDCVDEILAFTDTCPTLDFYSEPFRIHLACVQVLYAAGDTRAPEALETAHLLLMKHMESIPDEEMRRSFIENVPWNLGIIRLAQEHGLDQPRGSPDV